MTENEARNKAVFTTHIEGDFTIVTVVIDELTVPARYETSKAQERYGDVEAYEQRLKEGILNVAIDTLFPKDTNDGEQN